MNRLAESLRRHSFLFAAYAVWAAAALVFIFLILRETGGRFVYNLDDAYIHLAIAKHIVQNGVWGVTPYGFSSSSSSILWPLLLAGAFRLLGVREIVPFLFSLAASAVLIAILYRQWTTRGNSRAWAFGMLIAWMLVLPLGPILFNGMETMLQALASVVFCAAAVSHLSAGKSGNPAALCALAAFTAAVRYEGCFIAAAVCLLLFLRGRMREALLVGLSAALPVVLYGLYYVGQGWSFLPNSLLIKHSGVDWSDPVSLWGMIARPFRTVFDVDRFHLPVWQSLAVLLPVMLLGRARGDSKTAFWDARVLPAALFLLVALMHSMWITVESFYRYEAYLNALGIWAVGCAGAPAVDWTGLRRHAGAAVAGLCAAVVLAVPVWPHASQALWKTPVASRNIWQQQYQMGLFLREYYPRGIVAANDIGAIDYLAEIRLVDLFGLASRRVLQAKLEGRWESGLADALETITVSEDARVAVIYDNWFGYNPATGGADVPAQWIRVADWTIPGNVVCGGATVTWYALLPEEAPGLRSALEEFAGRMPAGVTVRYYT
jgi:hypothetical protein